MIDADTYPEADRLGDLPHPRDTATLFGQATAEAAFLEAVVQSRLHHGWLITGPKGVGKATLAWKIARYLLEDHETGAGLFGDTPSLETDRDSALQRRITAGSEPRLHLLRRVWVTDKKRLKAQITVDAARKLKAFYAMSAADGGRRVVIVDAADELNVNAANALLKVLEEPPADCIMLLIAHQPARLLATIRSRCRELRCDPLSADNLAEALAQAGIEAKETGPRLSELAAGSVGAAARLVEEDGVALYQGLVDLIGTCPAMDRSRGLKLAETSAARGKEARLDMTFDLILLLIARLARHGAGSPPMNEAAGDETATLARLSPDPSAARKWAELHQTLTARSSHGRAVNLDPSSLILDMLLQINDTAAETLSH